jgi:hypothetical protein
MPNTESLRPRTTEGKAVTNVHSKTNWENWSTETSTAFSPLDTPESSAHNMPNCSSLSLLSSLEEEEEINNNVPFPELEVPELDLELPLFRLKLRPSHSKMELLTSIAVVPDYDLDKFFTLAHPKVSMLTEMPQIFHGDRRAAENPVDFLKSFNRAMHQQTIIQLSNKLDAYGDYLRTTSQAEMWFKALPSTDKISWAAFIAAF